MNIVNASSVQELRRIFNLFKIGADSDISPPNLVSSVNNNSTSSPKTISGRPATATSRRSDVSFLSNSQRRLEFLKNNWRRVGIDLAKLSTIALPPMVLVIILCGVSLNSVASNIALQTKLEKNVKTVQRMGNLVTNLQKERGLTCVYITSLKQQDLTMEQLDKVRSDMENARIATDTVLDNLRTWLGDASYGDYFTDKLKFKQYIHDYRTTIKFNATDCYEMFNFYTIQDRKLLDQMFAVFESAEDSKFWAMVQALNILLISKDFYGLRRALGGSFFSQNGLTLDQYSKFSTVVGTSDNLLNVTLQLSDTVNVYFQQLSANNTELFEQLTTMQNAILANDTDQADINALVWYDNASSYITVLTTLESYVSQWILDALQKNVNGRQVELYLTITAVVLVLIVCPPLTAWYAYNSKRLMLRMESFANKLRERSKDLDMEKKRMELLLYQLLPKTVVSDLQNRKPVVPEQYEAATLYFSDIKGFTVLASRSTPFEIVELLNKLYTLFDGILDQYDVYKVETIGDSYMVVSGVPNPNGIGHSAAIATMALNILMAIEQFEIPHVPNERLLMRVGIHTGPLAAGVVGTKMPRYCLFGDTVNVASRMESSGMPMRIHLSTSAHTHLATFHPGDFEMQRRGTIMVKGRGLADTYWLVGKRDFPYRVDLNRSAEQLSNTLYWRPSKP